jgi:heterodisulfide reductase subunit B
MQKWYRSGAEVVQSCRECHLLIDRNHSKLDGKIDKVMMS